MEIINLPIYEGFESEFEDIIYSYFRRTLNDNGYLFKVKRTGFPEIDGIVPSYASGQKGRGSCDGYIFSSPNHFSLAGLVELETTGKIEEGIKQIRAYAYGFVSESLSSTDQRIVSNITRRKLVLIAYDGKVIYLSEFDLDAKQETIIFDKLIVSAHHFDISRKLHSLFSENDVVNRENGEKAILEDMSKKLRGHEKLQKNKALLMTILTSVYGTTKQSSYVKAFDNIKSSQVEYDKRLYETLERFVLDINETSDKDKIVILYERIAPRLYELSKDRGMDLYGFIYEELASKEKKKEQGEYYTPRRTIKPLMKAVFQNYLNWSKNDLRNKVIFDPFCGSGGFLYEYISLIKSIFNLDKREVDDIALKSIWGVDKNSILSAYLNLFLVGDGSANIERVKTSINWRRLFMYEKSDTDTSKVVRITDSDILKSNIKSSVLDLKLLLNMYVSKEFNYCMEEHEKHITADGDSLMNYLFDVLNFEKTGKTQNNLGNVDLLLTNIPYGDVTEANEQFIENGKAIYGNSLETNGLRECIDFLKPAKQKNGTIVEDGGIALAIVPDSILENPSNKPIRDYLIARCNILAIVGLPPYTFSPYAMEKTYALVFQKIAPEQFDYSRELKMHCFMYYSLCDGKANSQNRYNTDLMTKTMVTLNDDSKKEVVEYLHNDFESCFDSFVSDKYVYKSKLEWAWDYSFANKNRDWDQKRIIEEWNGNSWVVIDGNKWGYFPLIRYERNIEKTIKMKSLENKIIDFLSNKEFETIEDYTGVDNFTAFKKELNDTVSLRPKEKTKLEEMAMIKYEPILDEYKLKLIVHENVVDVDVDPNSHRYLGIKEQTICVESLYEELENQEFIYDEELIDFFRNQFISSNLPVNRLLNNFDIVQGVQFSKHDAYLYPGNIPVFTAATNGPVYFVNETIQNKVKINGPSLIWSRKGAKAGTIQLFSQKAPFYISDVSGVIRPKPFLNLDIESFVFLKYFLSGQVKREIQSKSNNAQLNKSKLENLEVVLPNNMHDLGALIIEKKHSMKEKESFDY